ncbi:hypothetical protein [Rivularia sp. UHCC 0363]|uniref:hypothetical protein n=1 Tax=Rivularia sp. UHCC 0363 TaxID=3110244 RepID=UPI002B21EA29|nr:hypothetical protein [Rivularia sp. UHCC 0363]MEA5596506.1 hypothetical protein [Rivularia sp. UHCC 0363]
MYSTKELTKYKGYVIQAYHHSHETLDKQWGYRIWKGYELMCVDEVGCKSSQEAIIAARKEIDRGFICRFYL